MEENKKNTGVCLDNVDVFIKKQQSNPPTHEELELEKINKRFNTIINTLQNSNENCEECRKALEILCSNEHRNNALRENVITKVSLSQDVKDNINRLIDECLIILKGIDYNNEISLLSDIFKDYCYRFNRLKESIN
jgi:hypothetical protein